MINEVKQSGESIVNYKVNVHGNRSDIDRISVTIIDEDGQVVTKHDESEGAMSIDNPHLWQPLNAYLYHMKVELLNDGEVVDVYTERFGIRSVEVKMVNSLSIINRFISKDLVSMKIHFIVGVA